MKNTHILLVEDNEGDILLTTEALMERNKIHQLSVVKNGKEAIDFLFKQGKYSEVKTPDLVLLDVNLPLKNGHEVLQIIKVDNRTRLIPVVMLTTSSSIIDINKSYEYRANCFITKPIDVEDFMKTILFIEDFWLTHARLPLN